MHAYMHMCVFACVLQWCQSRCWGSQCCPAPFFCGFLKASCVCVGLNIRPHACYTYDQGFGTTASEQKQLNTKHFSLHGKGSLPVCWIQLCFPQGVWKNPKQKAPLAFQLPILLAQHHLQSLSLFLLSLRAGLKTYVANLRNSSIYQEHEMSCATQFTVYKELLHQMSLLRVTVAGFNAFQSQYNCSVVWISLATVHRFWVTFPNYPFRDD